LARPSWWSSSLLAGGRLALALSLLRGSPWWAAVATVLSAGGLAGRYAVPEPGRSWLPAWLLLGRIVPWPFLWDLALLDWLQATSLQTASSLLDLVGMRHAFEGQIPHAGKARSPGGTPESGVVGASLVRRLADRLEAAR